MRRSARGPFCRPSSFVVVNGWRWAAVFVASVGMMMIGARATALAQRAELAKPESEERVHPATRHPPQMVPADDVPEGPVHEDIEAEATRSEAAPTFAPSPVGGSIWVAQGPAPLRFGQIENVVPNDEVVGAIHTVAAHPTDADILYIGAVNGGIWKTTDATAGSPTWTPQTDSFPGLAIGALQFDPTDGTNSTLVAGMGRFSSFGSVGPRRTGLLRTTDAGASWTQIDGGGTLVDKNISGVAARSSTIVASVNFSTPFTCPRIGIFRSTNGGASFTRISGGAGTGLPSSLSYDLAGDPNSSTTLYTGVNFADSCGGGVNGIYKSTNTGATWFKVSNAAMDALMISGSTSNIEIAVGSASSEVYVGILNFGRLLDGGIFRSGDGGATWTQMDLPLMPQGAGGVAVIGATNATPIVIASAIAHGLSTGDAVSITGVAGNTAANGVFSVFVLNAFDFELVLSTGNGAYLGGGTWSGVTGVNPGFKADGGDPGGQGSIHFSIIADPNDAHTVYVGGDRQDFPNFIGAFAFSGNLWRGDALVAPTGAVPSPQWEHLTHSNAIGAIPGGGTASSSAPHADSREMVFDANGDLIEVDDGGVYRRTSPQDNTGDWFSIIGDSEVNEQHDVAYDSNSNIIMSGNQDTGTGQQSASGSKIWDTVSQADGGDVMVDDTSLPGSSIRYSSFQNLGAFARRTYNAANAQVGGTVFPTLAVLGGGAALVPQFVTPVELNAVDQTHLVIIGDNSIYESLDKGDTLTEIGPGQGPNAAPSFSFQNAAAYGGFKSGVPNADVLYVGVNADVLIQTVSGGGLTASPTYPGGRVVDVVMDDDDWMTAYVISASAVFQTTDAGATWSVITGDLTGVGLLRSIEFIPGADDIVVVGADAGVFISLNSALGTWNELGTNLPNAPAYDLDYDPVDDVLVVGTLGRGAWIANGPIVPAPSGQPLTAPFPHDRRKNRYVSFDPNKADNDGTDVAFKVELKAITLGSCDGVLGDPPQVDFCRTDRVPPTLDCNTCAGAPAENSCINQPIDCASGTCTPTGETCVNDAPNSGGSNVGAVWWLGPEQNGVHLLVSQAFRKESTNWANPVHVGDCEIVPEARYGVRAVDVGSGSESIELLVETTLFATLSASWWGDCVGPLKKFCGGDIRTPECIDDSACTAPETCDRAWTLPDGSVNFDDVNAALALVAPGPTSVAPDTTWVDLHGNVSGTPGSQNFDPPNFVLNFSDIGQILSGFGGFPYKGYDPADCP